MLWATGAVADDDGELKVEATLEEGKDNAPGVILRGDGLQDAQGAEIHLVVRSHGPASDDPDVLDEQLTTVKGGCPPNTCVDEQFTVHVPGADD